MNDLLFSENPIYVNWNKNHKKYYLLNYILPNEDIEDINLIKRKNTKWNDMTISPKIRQTLQHWAYKLTKKDMN